MVTSFQRAFLLRHPVLCNNDNVPFQRLLLRIRGIEDLVDLFERSALCFDETNVFISPSLYIYSEDQMDM